MTIISGPLPIGADTRDVTIIATPGDWPTPEMDGRIPLATGVYAIEPNLVASDYRFRILPEAQVGFCGTTNLSSAVITTYTAEPIFVGDETGPGTMLFRADEIVFVAVNPTTKWFGFTDTGTRRGSFVLDDGVIVGGEAGEVKNFNFFTASRLAMSGCSEGFDIFNVGQVTVDPGQWTNGTDEGGVAYSFNGEIITVEMFGGRYDMAATESQVYIHPDMALPATITQFVDVVGANKFGAGSFYAAGSLDFQNPIVFVRSRGSGRTKTVGFGALQLNGAAAPTTDVLDGTPVRVNTVNGLAEVESAADNNRVEISGNGVIKMLDIDPIGEGTLSFVLGFNKAGGGSSDYTFQVRQQINSTGAFIDVPLGSSTKTFAASGDKDIVVDVATGWNEGGNEDSFELVVTGEGTTVDLDTKDFRVTVRG